VAAAVRHPARPDCLLFTIETVNRSVRSNVTDKGQGCGARAQGCRWRKWTNDEHAAAAGENPLRLPRRLSSGLTTKFTRTGRRGAAEVTAART
jgi:hypothetical protein